MRFPAPHSIHAPAASTPRQTDPPPDQSAPPNSPASRRAASARSPLASPAPASEVVTTAVAGAPLRAVRGFFLLRVSSARGVHPDPVGASLRYPFLFLPSPSILQPPHRRLSTRSPAASFVFFPARFPEFQAARGVAAAARR